MKRTEVHLRGPCGRRKRGLPKLAAEEQAGANMTGEAIQKKRREKKEVRKNEVASQNECGREK